MRRRDWRRCASVAAWASPCASSDRRKGSHGGVGGDAEGHRAGICASRESAFGLLRAPSCPLCEPLLLLLLLIVPMRLGAVAAGAHRAPAPVAALAAVEEQPSAFGIGALPHALKPRPDQQV